MAEEDLFFISDEEAGMRLDRVLANRFAGAGSRTYFQFLIEEGKVLLNGTPFKKRNKAKAGDEIEIEFILTPELELLPENIPLDIVYEDQDLLVVNKPSGMVVHPAPGHWRGTFVNALLYYCNGNLPKGQESLNPLQALRPGIVHRLDKNTSGLLIAAKTPLAQQRLIEMMANRRIYKEYVALCIGNPGSGDVDAPIGRHPYDRKLMAVIEKGGRSALTHFKTLLFNEKLSLVRLVIATGRTHQIRVHMKHLGHPVLGDDTYGVSQVNMRFGASRQMLHAKRLRFMHPIGGQEIDLEAPVPTDMQKIIDKITISKVG